MIKGTVKWYDHAKRFGFITTDEGEDVYVHATALAPTTRLHKGDVVEFAVEESEQGLQATGVVVVRAAEPDRDRGSDLLAQVERTLRRLEVVAGALREGRAVNGESAFYTARDMRRLAARLNPPAA